MSLYSALNSAVSGLQAQSNALSAISTNIANASTTGYKIVDTDFDSLVAASTSTSASASSAGGGISTSAYREMASQGEISSTTTDTNMAINGDGFFVVSASTTNATAGADLYTRDGSFSADSSGNLVNDSGDYLMGYATDSSGTPTSTSAGTLAGLTPVVVPTTTTVSPTTSATLAANLPAGLAVGGSVTNTMTVVDSEGVSQTIGETWTKTAANTWSVALSNPYTTGADGTQTTNGTTSPSTVTVSFDGNGVLASTNPSPVAVTLSGMTSGAANSTFTWNLGTVGATDGLTQYASSDSTNEISITSSSQNGTSQGSLTSTAISKDGLVTATYSNGQSIIVAKVPVATFANEEGLTQLSGSTFTSNTDSGSATLSTAGDGSAGAITGSALEASTTDTAAEFNKMIVAQQAYSAAAQVVTYVDKMFDTLIQSIS
jgi:flagellar hook protein FlgE